MSNFQFETLTVSLQLQAPAVTGAALTPVRAQFSNKVTEKSQKKSELCALKKYHIILSKNEPCFTSSRITTL